MKRRISCHHFSSFHIYINQSFVKWWFFMQQDANRNLSMLKAVLPYFPTSSQKNLIFLLKVLEVRKVLNQFELEQEKILSSCSVDNRSLEGLCNTLKDFCSEKEQEILDTWINTLQAMQLFREYSNNSSQKTASNPMDMLQNMLTPEQKSMLDTYKTLFSTMP